MFSCPHCQFQLTGKAHVQISHGSSEAQIKCSHCEAVLRIQITTLHEPNEERLKEGGINESKAPTTACPECHHIMPVTDWQTHKCR
jgi:uncharacterized protein YlaI